MAMQRARVSSRDVARAAGVSVNTVSLVVREISLVARGIPLAVVGRDAGERPVSWVKADSELKL